MLCPSGRTRMRWRRISIVRWHGLTRVRGARSFSSSTPTKVHAPFRRTDVFSTESGDRQRVHRPDSPNLRGQPRRPTDGFVPRAVPMVARQQCDGPQPLLADVDGRLDAAYDGGVSYADAQVGTAVERASESADLKRTRLSSLTSDHGEMLGEHEEFGHGGLHEEVIRVPLVLAYPDPRWTADARLGRRCAPLTSSQPS